MAGGRAGNGILPTLEIENQGNGDWGTVSPGAMRVAFIDTTRGGQRAPGIFSELSCTSSSLELLPNQEVNKETEFCLKGADSEECLLETIEGSHFAWNQLPATTRFQAQNEILDHCQNGNPTTETILESACVWCGFLTGPLKTGQTYIGWCEPVDPVKCRISRILE